MDQIEVTESQPPEHICMDSGASDHTSNIEVRSVAGVRERTTSQSLVLDIIQRHVAKKGRCLYCSAHAWTSVLHPTKTSGDSS